MAQLFILSAPSGTGKTTLVCELIKRLKDTYKIERAITYTSKKPRASEVHGKDYYFVSEDQFKDKIKQGFFLEWSTAYGAYYGLPKDILQKVKQGVSYIAVLDRIGARAIKAQVQDCIGIWIKPPSLDELKKRLYKRAEDTEEVINYRFDLACKELREEEQECLFNYTIINDIFERALCELEALVKGELAGDKN
jgi:guanylate kinase